ncbi:MAG: phosphate acetyltransferase [Halofilum sp. (in: g-proteobacteria)]|nr:phosphate acetyltransferase [Halofilum sp. (in: g-proteobacteria)]
MAHNLYITTTEPRSGKSAIVLGVMEMLLRNLGSVGFFRPIVDVDEHTPLDRDIRLVREYFKLEQPVETCHAYTLRQAAAMLNEGRQAELLDGVLSSYKALEGHYDFVLCEGTDFEGVTSAFEFDINVDIANNIGSPVLLVANGRGREAEDVVGSTAMALDTFRARGVHVLGAVINRAPAQAVGAIAERLQAETGDSGQLGYVVPEEPLLGQPTPREVAGALGAEVLTGADRLDKPIGRFTVAAMEVHHFLDYVEEGSLVVVPGDRSDVILASLASRLSSNYPDIAAILLTGGLAPEASVRRLIEGWTAVPTPLLLAQEDTFTISRRLSELHTEIDPADSRKVASALRVFEAHVAADELRERLVASRPVTVTPKMFEYGLIQQAKREPQRIVMPEGSDERILRAADILVRRDVARIVVLGNVDEVQERLRALNLDSEGIDVVDPATSGELEDYVNTYHELRQHKGITLDNARDMMADPTYFGTMMVHKGHADGMVSGAVNTTRHTVRPAFEFIRTKPGAALVSSVFLMCLRDRVLVYGDCAVNPNPNAEQLASIALSAAETARTFGIEPRVALLSYSSGSSGQGSEVEKVREATRLAREQAPELALEGPIQYDAAIDPNVARSKMPDSAVAGRATVFIFPDLNTGNNTYKAVQRSAEAVAIGPVLQGLRKPINDLSRGCTVADIVNTVAITAIQAQAEKAEGAA